MKNLISVLLLLAEAPWKKHLARYKFDTIWLVAHRSLSSTENMDRTWLVLQVLHLGGHLNSQHSGSQPRSAGMVDVVDMKYLSWLEDRSCKGSFLYT